MFDAIAIVCFFTTHGPVCAMWRDERNPHATFEKCDKATDHFIQTSDARFEGMGHVQIKAGCVQASPDEKRS